MRVNLLWPPKELSPNARVHWSKRSKAAKKYRADCCYTVKAAKPGALPEGPLHLWLTFFPPDKRHRDDDNMIAAFKAGRDGIADALGVDDKRFICHPMVSDQTGGYVLAVVTGGPNG